nr:transcription initiation factor TFIID subunit 4-like [Dasypus novemcinctus]
MHGAAPGPPRPGPAGPRQADSAPPRRSPHASVSAVARSWDARDPAEAPRLKYAGPAPPLPGRGGAGSRPRPEIRFCAPRLLSTHQAGRARPPARDPSAAAPRMSRDLRSVRGRAEPVGPSRAAPRLRAPSGSPQLSRGARQSHPFSISLRLNALSASNPSQEVHSKKKQKRKREFQPNTNLFYNSILTLNPVHLIFKINFKEVNSESILDILSYCFKYVVCVDLTWVV